LQLRESAVSGKQTEKERNRELLLLATSAQKLLQEFVRLPFTEPERATELLNEFDRAVAEFKRLQSAIAASRSRKARIFRLAEAPARRLCPVCEQRVVLRQRNYVEVEDAVYHRACARGVVRRRLGLGSS
jgi:hypothetical protein